MKKTMDTAMDRRAVKEYLQQYHMAKEAKKILEDRRRTLTSELTAPASSSFGQAKRKRQPSADGAVSVVVRIAEVEDRITAQQEEMAKAALHVMDLVDLLPAGSMERTVVEMRHIDCNKWERIASKVHMSRSRVIDYYNAALDTLLTYERTRKLVGDYIGTGEG